MGTLRVIGVMKSTNSNLPLLLKAIRKHQRLGQVQVAKYLNLEQSSYSRVESGSQKLTAEQWFLFCEMTQTPPDAAFLGYIDFLRPIGSQGIGAESEFDLPERYAFERGSSIRKILPLVEYAKKEWGKKKWTDYLQKVELKPDFFLYLDNEINLNFEMDLARELIKGGSLTPKALPEILAPVTTPSFQGQLRFHYRNVQEPSERLKKLFSDQKHYETYFNYTVLEESPGSMDISVTPGDHLGAFSYRKDSILHDHLCRYRKTFLKSFSEGETHKNHVHIRELGCQYKEAQECTYQVSFQN